MKLIRKNYLKIYPVLSRSQSETGNAIQESLTLLWRTISQVYG